MKGTMKRAINGGLLPTLAAVSGAFILAGMIHTSHASEHPVDWQAYNLETLNDDILPAYQRFASSAESLVAASNALCQTPSANSLENARTAFRSTLNAWQGVSHIQFGPVTYLMRNYSIEYWPDRKGIGRKQLRNTLNLPADTPFDETFFHEASVSIKGLPALEQLLFAEDALSQLSAPGVHCRLTQAIAGNLSEMAGGIYKDWQREGISLAQAAASDEEGEVDESAIPPFSVDLMKSLIEPVELIRDTKLLAVMGKGPDATFPHRAESWLSEQSLASIRANIDAAYALFKGEHAGVEQLLGQHGEADLAIAIDQQFKILQGQVDPLGDSLTAALSSHYPELKEVALSLKVLDTLLIKAAQALNVQLGFNSRDGD